MIHTFTPIRRDLTRLLPELPALEVKGLLALMLDANPAGICWLSLEEFADHCGVPLDVAEVLLQRLLHDRLVSVERRDDRYLVSVARLIDRPGLPLADLPQSPSLTSMATTAPEGRFDEEDFGPIPDQR